MTRGDGERLADIASAIETIHRHMKAPKNADELKHDAVLYDLVIIGEAVKSLSDDTKAQRPDVPWRQIAGLRDLLAHEYFRIDMIEIAKIVESDLAALSEAVAALRADGGHRPKRFLREGPGRYRRAGRIRRVRSR